MKSSKKRCREDETNDVINDINNDVYKNSNIFRLELCGVVSSRVKIPSNEKSDMIRPEFCGIVSPYAKGEPLTSMNLCSFHRRTEDPNDRNMNYAKLWLEQTQAQ